MTDRIDHDWHTAIHEAGHAAADLILGHGCLVVSIVRNKDDATLGHASPLDGDVFTSEGMEKLVISIYAGAEAMRAVVPTGELWAERIRNGSRGDDAAAAEYLRHCRYSADELRNQSAQLVREHWALIELLARELLKYRVLSGEEVDILKDVIDGETTYEELQEYRGGLAAESLSRLEGRSAVV